MVEVSLSKLKWAGILVPTLFILGFEYLTHFVIHPWILSEREVYFVIVGVIGLGAGLFSHGMFSLIERMQWQVMRREQVAEALYRVSTEISALADINRVLGLVVEKARSLFNSEAAVLCLRDEATGALVARAGRGRLSGFVVGEVVHTGCPGLQQMAVGLEAGTSGGCVSRCVLMEKAGLQTCLAVPLPRGKEVIGALCVASREGRSFAREDVRLLEELATQAAIAIENARLYEKTQQLAVAAERDRLAREMHDGLAQVLGYICVKARTAEALLAAGEADRVGEELEKLRHVAQAAHADVRECILGLKTTISGERGLTAALKEYVRSYSLQSGIRTELVVDTPGEVVPLSPTAEVQLLRIVQEALTNVRKHSGATRVMVRMWVEGDRFCVVVEDNGRGFSARPRTEGLHFGLQTMAERARSVGGLVEIESRPGQGTRVLATLPLAQTGGDERDGH